MAKKSKFPIVLVVIGVLAIVVVGGWFMFLKKPDMPTLSVASNFTTQDTVIPMSEYDSLPEYDADLDENPDYEVTYIKRSASASYSEWCTLGANNDILYPGALLNLEGDEVKPLSTGLSRRPVKISANFESLITGTGQAAPLSAEADAELDKVRLAISGIVNANLNGKTTLPSNISMEIEEVSSEEEFYLSCGLGIGYNGFNLAEKFETKELKKQTNLVITLKQIYYTIDCNYDGNPRTFFSATTPNTSIKSALEGTVPAYVSSVSYGRIVMIGIQTDYSAEEIKNVLELGWNSKGSTFEKGTTPSFSLDNTIQNIAKDSSTKISYYVYGGSTQDTAKTIAAIYDGSTGNLLYDIFSKDYDVSGALPITYTIRNFDGTLAGIERAEEYTVKKIEYIPKRLMDWSFYTKMLEDGSILEKKELILDLSSMINYSDPSATANVADITILMPEKVKKLTLRGGNNLTSEIVYQQLSLELPNPIELVLENISFVGRDGLPAIKTGTKTHDFKITCKGSVNVEGGQGAAGIWGNGEVVFSVLTDSTAVIRGGVGYEGKTGGTGVYMEGDFTVEAAKYTQVTFMGGTGGKGADGADGVESSAKGQNGSSGADGGIGIEAENLTVLGNATKKLEGELYIVGGVGGTGGNGGNGAAGKGVYGGSGGYSGYGYNGGDGGAGGTGGTGGIVMDIAGEAVFTDIFVTLETGSGGLGGNGGVGGKGADGQVGKDAVRGGLLGANSEIGSKGGRGGDGGVGGNGGNGGNANVKSTEYFEALSTTYALSYTSGVWGNGGDGGAGGDGGDGGDGGSCTKGEGKDWCECNNKTCVKYGGKGGDGGNGGDGGRWGYGNEYGKLGIGGIGGEGGVQRTTSINCKCMGDGRGGTKGRDGGLDQAPVVGN